VSLILLPAVDVVEGRAVRLVQGRAGSETEYGSALDAALGWQRDGAHWVHLVDLDAAFGRGSNRELLAEVVGKLDVHVELSGGIRDDDSLKAALATGCARVNLGTAALENPQWCAQAIAEHGDKVAVGLDVHIDSSNPAGQHRLRGRGWETDGGDLWEVLERLDSEGCSRFVVTDVTKDGTLTGPNLALLGAVAERTDAPVIASGGVSSLDDLRAIATLTAGAPSTRGGIEGAIVGKALYAGRFSLPQALAAVAQV
jgi:phosphoribosyl isomerase A